MSMPKRLTERQSRFVTEFIKDGNATQAAIRAGFSKNGAKVTASQLLAKPNLQLAIAEARGPVLETAQITMAGHLAELASIRDAAKRAEQYAAANAAEANRGKVAGLYVDRTMDVTELSRDERKERLLKLIG